MRGDRGSLVPVFWVLLVAGFVVVAVFQPREKPEPLMLNDSVVTIGFVEMWGNYSRSVALFEEIIEPEVNRYAEESGSGVRFDFVVVQAEDASSSLERVQSFHAVGVRYVIGSNCLACTSYSYIEHNDMMLVSSRSRQPDFNMVDEHMFRVCPHDADQGIALARVLESRGISRVAVLRRVDARADTIFDVFSDEYSGDILVDVRYPAEAVEFGNELAIVESSLSGLDDSAGVGLLVLSNAEVQILVEQASEYPSVIAVPWFGADSTAKLDASEYIDSIEGFERVGLYSVSHGVEYGEKWDWLAVRYLNVTGVYPDSVVGYDYDAAWLYVLTLLETDSLKRSVLAETLPVVGAGYRGATGFIVLDEAGDRVNAFYDVCGYLVEDGVTVCRRVGFFDGTNRSVNWIE